MDLKTYIAVEVTVNGNDFKFIMPSGASYGSAIDAAYQIYIKVVELAAEAAKKSKPTQEN
jgi:hypothetical protein